MKALLVVVALIAYASATTSWNLANNVLTITGSGDMTDYAGPTYPPWSNSRLTIKKIIIGDNVKKIGTHAFDGCSAVTSVSFGSSVKKIKDYAFNDCSSLPLIELPSEIEEIGKYAFSHCSSLSYVDLSSEELEKIDDYAFSSCTSLESVNFPGLEKIKEGCFDGCSSLKTVEIEDGVEEIQDGAFRSCNSLEEIVIPRTVTTIKAGAFEDCLNLTQVTYRGTLVNPIAGSSDPFRGCSLSHLCVSRDYPFDKFGQRPVYPRSTSPELAPILAEENHCFEAMICNQTYGIIMERFNATKWENQGSNRCGTFYCNNETGPAMYSDCNSTAICFGSSSSYRNPTCQKADVLPEKGWTVQISFENVSATRYDNKTMRAAILNMTGEDEDFYGREISKDGYLLNFYYILYRNYSAQKVADVLTNTLGKSNCTYGLICEGVNVTIIDGIEYDAAYHVVESVFILVLAIIVSLVSF